MTGWSSPTIRSGSPTRPTGSTPTTRATGKSRKSRAAMSIVDPKSASVDGVISDMVRPNGIAFSPDEKLLYVADTGATHFIDGPRHIRRFTVADDGKSLTGGEVFAESTAGLFDGF